MYLRYGGYTHAANEATVSIDRENLRNEADQWYAIRETWNITGQLIATPLALLSIAIDQLLVAYEIPFQDLDLLLNDGLTPSSHFLRNAGSISGVQVIRGPSFPESRGAEYATYRTYNIVVQAEYPVADSGLLNYTETLQFSGGGPLYGHLVLLDDLPQKQVLNANTPYRCVQHGQAVGYATYPLPAPSIWPGALMKAPDIVWTAPRRRGLGYQGWQVEWTYEHEDARALVGLPHLWP
jgi:hypothetical protein